MARTGDDRPSDVQQRTLTGRNDIQVHDFYKYLDILQLGTNLLVCSEWQDNLKYKNENVPNNSLLSTIYDILAFVPSAGVTFVFVTAISHLKTVTQYGHGRSKFCHVYSWFA